MTYELHPGPALVRIDQAKGRARRVNITAQAGTVLFRPVALCGATIGDIVRLPRGNPTLQELLADFDLRQYDSWAAAAERDLLRSMAATGASVTYELGPDFSPGRWPPAPSLRAVMEGTKTAVGLAPRQHMNALIRVAQQPGTADAQPRFSLLQLLLSVFRGLE